MDRTLLLIALAAAAWHLGIIGLMKMNSRNGKRTSIERLLRLMELDMLKRLKERLEGFPREKRDDIPYDDWLNETRYWLRRIEENSKRHN